MKTPRKWSRLLVAVVLALLLCVIPISVSASSAQADSKRSGVTINFYDPNAPLPDYEGSTTPDERWEFDSTSEGMGPGGGVGETTTLLPVGIPQVSGNVSMVKNPNSLGELPKTGGGALPGYLLLAGGCLLILLYGISQGGRRQPTHG